MRVRPVNQLDHGLGSGVTTAVAQLRDASVATGTIGNDRSDRIEQFLQNGLVVDETANHTAAVEVHTIVAHRTSLLGIVGVACTRDELLGERTELLGLCYRRDQALVLEQRRCEVAHHSPLVAGCALQFPSGDTVSHGS